MKIFRLLRAGWNFFSRHWKPAPEPHEPFLYTGEIAYNIDKAQLWVGNGTDKPSVVSEVVTGPQDGNAYAKLDGHAKLIPLVFRRD